MSAGRGYIALAALIFAKWRPWQVLGACFLFGFLEAISNRYQDIEIWSVSLPVQFMQALPYILTVIIWQVLLGRLYPNRASHMLRKDKLITKKPIPDLAVLTLKA